VPLLGLLGHQVIAPGTAVCLDGLFAPLDLPDCNLDEFLVVQRTAQLDLAVLHGSRQQPKGSELDLFPSLERGPHLYRETLLQLAVARGRSTRLRCRRAGLVRILGH
jgi:hypothetical protein